MYLNLEMIKWGFNGASEIEKYQDIMLISSDDFEVGNATYLNILVKDINNLEKHITSQFIVEQLEENHGTLKKWL